MKPEEVASFLKEHPEFFAERPELLTSIQVPHPYGAHAIPLAERQVLTLRERGRALEGKLRELVQFGEENDAIGDRMHRLTLAMLASQDRASLLLAVKTYLKEDFGIPAVALRLWGLDTWADGEEFQSVEEETRVFAESLSQPYFSERAMFDSGSWFDVEAEAFHSFVYLPLRKDRSLGVLAMASADPARFTAGMGTLYLTRLGEMVSVGLERHGEA